MQDSQPAARLLERYLHRHIPLSRAMRVTVLAADEAGVRLAAPLDPNINHRGTAFGGSLAALAILSGWAFVHVGLRAEGLAGPIVIQRNSVEYLRPVEGDFEAYCPAPGAEEWARFLATMRRRSRGRIALHARLLSATETVGSFHGAFVATLRVPHDAGSAG